MDITLILKAVLTAAFFWHVLAFAAGGVYVFHSYIALFSGNHSSSWSRVIRSVDWQLWVSGFAIIGLSIVLLGSDQYLANPKLWTKTLLISIWLISTQTMRLYAVPRLYSGYRTPMLLTSSINAACWVYGAFLGVAKPLAFGVAPFSVLIGGWIATILAFLTVTVCFEKRRNAVFH